MTTTLGAAAAPLNAAERCLDLYERFGDNIAPTFIRQGDLRQVHPWEVSLVARYGPADPFGPCERGRVTRVDPETGDPLERHRCKSHRECRSCARWRIARLGREIAWDFKPTAFITLTGLPADWTEIRTGMKHLRLDLKRKGWADWSMVWTVEPNPSGDGAHAHGWAKRSVPTVNALTSSAARVGWGSVDRRDVYSRAPVAMTYGLKLPQHNRAAAEDYRHLNGSRLVHRTTSADQRDNRISSPVSQFG